jgi:Cu-processing system ATP-binding protein
MITIRNVVKRFGRQTVLDSVSVDIAPRHVTAILGPNGAGKTTLIKCMLGLVKPDLGDIRIGDTLINGGGEYRHRIGYMPQYARYPENLTAAEIIAMIRDIRGFPADEDTELINAFHLRDEWNKPFKVLSGGNRQKVSAVLAFLFRPDVLFLDEPTAGLDPRSSAILKDKIRLARDHNRTILLTSHILSEVQELADHVVYLIDGNIRLDEPMNELIRASGEANLERAIAARMYTEAV